MVQCAMMGTAIVIGRAALECKEYIEAMTPEAYLNAGLHWLSEREGRLDARCKSLPLSMISCGI
jgi:hypothetical protein